MGKRQWSTTYDEDILKNFAATCDEYGVKQNAVLEALMKFFIEGNCRLFIDKTGMNIEVKKEDTSCVKATNQKQNASSGIWKTKSE